MPDRVKCPGCNWTGERTEAVVDGPFRCCPECHCITQPANEDTVMIPKAELARLRGIEEAARFHLRGACATWPSGEVLALALGLNPDAPREAFARLLDLLGVEHDEHDPMARWLDD